MAYGHTKLLGQKRHNKNIAEEMGFRVTVNTAEHIGFMIYSLTTWHLY